MDEAWCQTAESGALRRWQADNPCHLFDFIKSENHSAFRNPKSEKLTRRLSRNFQGAHCLKPLKPLKPDGLMRPLKLFRPPILTLPLNP